MVELTPLINGREYGWADINVVIGGVPLTGIRGIKYGSSQEKENVYGAGRHPVARGYGRVTSTASITLLAGTVLALQNSAPSGELHRIQPFPITIVYQPDAGPLVTHVLRNAEFTETNFEWAEGDMSKEIELPLIISDIQKKA
jgi:hypothetical protein